MIDKEDLSFLKILQAEMINQETDGQAAPRFWVLRQIEHEPTSEEYANDYVYVETDEYTRFEFIDELTEYLRDYELASREQIEELEGYNIHNAFEYVLENLNEDKHFGKIPVKRIAKIIPNTLFLTKKAAIKHMEANHYHYNDTVHTYAMTAWRSPEVESLFKIIENIDLDKLEEMI